MNYRAFESWKVLTIPSFGLAVASLFVVVPRAGAQASSYTGVITDAKLNCESTPMKAVEGIRDKTSCVLYWAHYAPEKEKYVLYDATTKTAYALDDQEMVQPFAGEKVQVTGTLDAAKKSLKVTGIKVP
jgi:hypothetical protein